MIDARAIAAEVERQVNADRLVQAEATIKRALAREPRNPALNQVAALLMTRLGKPDQAVFFAERAAAAAPEGAELHYTLGLCLTNTPRKDEAEARLVRAMQLGPGEAKYAVSLARLYVEQHRPDDAERTARRALEIEPDSAGATCILARLLAESGRADEALGILQRAGTVHPRDPFVHHLLCVTMNYVSGPGAAEITETHRRTALHYSCVPAIRPTTAWRPDPERPLRVGILSADLRRHAVAYFLEGLIEHRDHSRLQVYLYSDGGSDDDVSGRLQRAASAWRPISQTPSAQVLAMMRQDGIDVLVECLGHLNPSRLGLLAMRPAPVQATYLAYPNTLGLPAVEYRLVDELTDPAGSDTLSTEQLVRLDSGCFLCYRPETDAPRPSPRPEGSSIVFGSFNNLAKISDATADLWGRLLASTPGSRMLLKASHLHERSVQDRIAARFADRGVARERLVFMGRVDSVVEHLGAYALVDIGLDPFPYHGTTTTCEALWMGVPVVSLIGDRHASRVGLSILTAAGKSEWCAGSPDEYVSIARTLAGNPRLLAALRTSLRETLRGSRLCDANGQAQAFEHAIRHAWRGWCGSASI